MSTTTILIVEDERIVALDLAGKLEQLGYEVAGTAMRGDEAVTLARRLRPNLVLMDISLEGPLDGIEAVEAIHREQDVPVVYLTAHSDPATLTRAKLTGPFGYILKPFELRDLATQIELALYRHQADRQLSEQREWLRVTLSSIGDAVIATDAEGRISFVNPVAESLTGWKAEEAAGQPIECVFRIVNEQTGQPSEKPVARVLREGRAVELANHTALVTKDGRMVPIEDSAAPILDAAGQVIGAVLVFHDVTEKRRAEEAARESRARLQAAFASMSEAIFVADAEGRLVDFNDEFVRYHRFRDRGECSRAISDCPKYLDVWFPDGTPAPVEQWAMPRALRGETASNVEYRLRRKETGETWWGSYSFAPIKDQDGRITGAVVAASEITERKAAEEALRESEERLRLLGDNLPESAVYQYLQENDGGVRFLYLSAGIERLNGVSVADVLRDAGTLHRQIPPEYIERFVEAEARSKRDLTDFDMELPMRRPDGELRWMRLHSRPRRLPDGRTIWDGVQIDITASKRAKQALLESERRERERAEELAVLFEAVPTPVFIARDPDCLHLTGNRLADEILRLPHGNELSMSGPAETRPRHFKAVKDGRELRLDELPAQRAARPTRQGFRVQPCLRRRNSPPCIGLRYAAARRSGASAWHGRRPGGHYGAQAGRGDPAQERAGVSRAGGGRAADRLGNPARWLEHLFQSTMGGLHRADAG